MSAFLTSNASISAISQLFIELCTASDTSPADQLIKIGSDLLIKHGETPSKAQQRATSLVVDNPIAIAEVVHQVLLVENVESLKARYGDPTMWEHAGDYRYHPHPDVDQWISDSAFGNFKVIMDCYEYQSCEHSDWSFSLGSAVCEFIRSTLADSFKENKTTVKRELLWDWSPSSELDDNRAMLERLFAIN